VFILVVDSGVGTEHKTPLTHRCSKLLLDRWTDEWINEMVFGFPKPLLYFSQFMSAFVLFTLFERRFVSSSNMEFIMV